MTRTTLFTNGKFFAGEDCFTSSVAVRGGRIVDIGNDNSLDNNHIIDLKGRLVLPAFVDAHCHLLLLGESLTKIDLQGCTSLTEIISRLKAHHDAYPYIKRLHARNWIQDMTRPDEVDRRSLDQFEKPVILESFDLHSGLLNSAALREFGIDENTEAPAGGEIVKDSQNRVTGWLKEMAFFQLCLAKIRDETTLADKRASIRRAFDALIDAGYTAVADLLMEEDLFAIFEDMVNEEGRLPLRVRCYWHCPPKDDIEESLKHVERAKELQQKWHANEWLGINGIKIVSDGVIDACTAALLLPYQDGTSAEPLWALDDLTKAVQKADSLDLQCAIHAIGDRAVRNAVDAYASVGRDRVRRNRHRIEHLELSAAEDGDRMGELGITASVQPVHSDPAFLSNWYQQLGGKSAPRCCRAFAYKHFLEAGASVAIGTDAPTAPHWPLPNLHIATTRTSAADPSLAEAVTPQFALPLVAAVSAATEGAARACLLDGWQGKLDMGLSADFNVLQLDVFSAPGHDSQMLLKTKILQTYREGELVASAP